jgi:adenine-specific DNA-methyltransferase
LTTASILLFANDKEKSEVEFINIRTLDELTSLQKKIQSYPKNKSEKSVSFSELNPEIKWRAYYQKQNAARFKNLVPFSNYGKVVRGIATGANEYFTFSQSKATTFNISEKNLLPCITKSVDVSGSFFTKEKFEELKRQDKSVYLFNANEMNEMPIKNYISKGEAEEINKKFLTASRNPWYSLEKRKPAPIWVSVFNRNGLRFIRNEAMISNLTTFHCIYLNMFSEPKVDLLFAYLLTDISKEIFNDNRREYGNGLHKFEPNDINKALMLDLDKIEKKDEEKILSLYCKYRKSELSGKANAALLEEMNEIFVTLLT